MLVPTVIMAIIAIVLVYIGFQRGDGSHQAGLNTAYRMTLQILPLLIFAFIIAGMIQVLLPKEFLSKWVGTESGFRGILIGSFAGALAPGGPYVSLPLVAGLLKAGAGVPTMIAFLTGWSLWAFNRIPMEVGILGWKFVVFRFISVLIFPPLAGLIAQWLCGGAKV